MSLTELYLSPLLQVLEVPADERVVVGVGVRGDERPTPINLNRKDYVYLVMKTYRP